MMIVTFSAEFFQIPGIFLHHSPQTKNGLKPLSVPSGFQPFSLAPCYCTSFSEALLDYAGKNRISTPRQ
jgi:hypothetical protein